jgi:hypothetical protein
VSVLTKCCVYWTQNNYGLRKRHIKREKKMERAKGERDGQQSEHVYTSITENIYYSQMSSVAILLQPEPNCFTSYNTRK